MKNEEKTGATINITSREREKGWNVKGLTERTYEKKKETTKLKNKKRKLRKTITGYTHARVIVYACIFP